MRKFSTILLLIMFLSNTSMGNVMNDDNDDYYNVMNSDTVGHLNMSFALGFEYIDSPLRITTGPGGKHIETIVNWRQNMSLTSSVGFKNWFQMDFVFSAMLGQSVIAELLKLDDSAEDIAFYDMRLVPRINVLRTGTFSLGGALPFTLPSGNEASFVGEEGATITPTLLVGLRTNYFQTDLNIGYTARTDQSYRFNNQDITADDELIYGLGLRIPLVEKYGLLHRLDLQGDVRGSMSIYEQDKEFPLEITGGIQVHLKHDIVMTFGVGGDLTRRVGTPRYRVVWGFGWEFEHPKPRKSCKNITIPVPVEVPVKVPVVKKVTVINHHLILPPVFFSFDKDVILKQSYPTLQAVVDILKRYKNIREVVLGGHTDARGSDEYNFSLGLKRAISVKKMLIEMGINPKRMVTVTYGEWESAVKNAKGNRDHARNRRVDFNVIK
jgi:outer membrane protein OmpA-like peptidoglycan-associated protein